MTGGPIGRRGPAAVAARSRAGVGPVAAVPIIAARPARSGNESARWREAARARNMRAQ